MKDKMANIARKIKTPVRVVAFLMVFLLIFSAVSGIFQPVWFEWNNFYTIHGFYEEPKNTIETIFLGASVMAGGINPAQLYQEHGMCAYNLGTVHQPLISSYYWMEEAYRLHSKTLKNVVLDVSLLREETTDAFFHKSIDEMQFSPVKVRMAFDYADGSLTEALNYLVPFITYHTRWSELEPADFDKNDYETVNGTRGYHFQRRINLTENSVGGRFDFSNAVVRRTQLIEEAPKHELYDEALGYLDRMYNFCQERGIQLLLVKTPTTNWSSGWHHAVQEVADQYGLTFLDFRYTPLIDELNLIFELETTDSRHLNHYGATKLTSWIGEYLVQECEITDVRGDKRYAHMDEQMELYAKNVLRPLELSSSENVAEYLERAMAKDYTVLMTVRDEASNSLTDEQRLRFSEMGLTELATIDFRDSYMAVIDNGTVVMEQLRRNEGLEEGAGPIVYEGVTRDGVPYCLKSGGYASGMIGSCVFDGKEEARNWRGINIVVYDNVTGEIVNDTVFDTYETSCRDVYTIELLEEVQAAPSADGFEPDSLRYNLWNYLYRVNLDRLIMAQNETVDPMDLFGYLRDYQSDPDNVILLSVKGDAAGAMDDAIRTTLTYSGFPVLASINEESCYAGYVVGGDMAVEKTGHVGETVSVQIDQLTAKSSGAKAGNDSSILIDGIEYSPDANGLNIVVYNRAAGSVVSWYTFETGVHAMTVADDGM